MVLDALKKINYPTRSVLSAKDKTITFVRSDIWITRLQYRTSNMKKASLVVLAPWGAKFSDDLITPLHCDDPEKEFVLYHNWYYRDTPQPRLLIAKGVDYDPSAIIGVDSMKYIYDPKTMKSPVHMKHIGTVVIEEGVKIYQHVTIHRGSLDDTLIKKNVYIGAYTNVGHNCIIEENTIITPYTSLGGSVHIGKNCFVGMGVVIRDGVIICDRVKIGMGSLVVKHITEPGLYYGSPAERKGDWNGEWHK